MAVLTPFGFPVTEGEAEIHPVFHLYAQAAEGAHPSRYDPKHRLEKLSHVNPA